MTAEEVMETDTLEEEEETVAELAITESEIFCEPPEPYFITTDSVSEEMMQMENFEPALVKSASVEFMKSGTSNVRHTDVNNFCMLATQVVEHQLACLIPNIMYIYNRTT